MNIVLHPSERLTCATGVKSGVGASRRPPSPATPPTNPLTTPSTLAAPLVQRPPLRVISVDPDLRAREFVWQVCRQHADQMQLVADYSSAETALDRLAADRADVVLQALVMPGMKGLELLYRLLSRARRVGGHPGLPPVVVLTACDDPKIQALCRDWGATGYLVKPADENALARAVLGAGFGNALWPSHLGVHLPPIFPSPWAVKMVARFVRERLFGAQESPGSTGLPAVEHGRIAPRKGQLSWATERTPAIEAIARAAEFSSSGLAALCCLRHSRFCDLFRKCQGGSAADTLRDLRYSEALDLDRRGFERSDIARQVGFKHTASLARFLAGYPRQRSDYA